MVKWSQVARNDLVAMLDRALERAIDVPDPHIYAAALDQETRIRSECRALDGAATYVRGPIADSYLYVTDGGRFVILYRRIGQDVEIERILPSRSDWNQMP